MPGAPPSASTIRPESSAKAGSCATRAAATAFILALDWNVPPVSSGSPRPSSPAETACTPCGASSSRISASLPGLWVAMTSLPVIWRCMLSNLSHRQFLQVHQACHTLARQRHQGQELFLRERCLLGGSLNLDDVPITGHDKICVGLGFGNLRIVEIEYGDTVIDPAGYRGYVVTQHVALDHVARLHPGDAVGKRHPRAGNRCCARAAIS